MPGFVQQGERFLNIDLQIFDESTEFNRILGLGRTYCHYYLLVAIDRCAIVDQGEF